MKRYLFSEPDMFSVTNTVVAKHRPSPVERVGGTILFGLEINLDRGAVSMDKRWRGSPGNMSRSLRRLIPDGKGGRVDARKERRYRGTVIAEIDGRSNNDALRNFSFMVG